MFFWKHIHWLILVEEKLTPKSTDELFILNSLHLPPHPVLRTTFSSKEKAYRTKKAAR